VASGAGSHPRGEAANPGAEAPRAGPRARAHGERLIQPTNPTTSLADPMGRIGREMRSTGAPRMSSPPRASGRPPSPRRTRSEPTRESVDPVVSAVPESRDGHAEAIGRLLREGRRKGFVTVDEVSGALPDPVSSAQIEEVFEVFGEHDIEVRDERPRARG